MLNQHIKIFKNLAQALENGERIWFKDRFDKNADYEVFNGESFDFSKFTFKSDSELKESLKETPELDSLHFYKRDLTQGLNFAKPFVIADIQTDAEDKIWLDLYFKESEYFARNSFTLSLKEFRENFVSVKDKRLFYFFEFRWGNDFYTSQTRLNHLEATNEAKTIEFTDWQPTEIYANFGKGIFLREELR